MRKGIAAPVLLLGLMFVAGAGFVFFSNPALRLSVVPPTTLSSQLYADSPQTRGGLALPPRADDYDLDYTGSFISAPPREQDGGFTGGWVVNGIQGTESVVSGHQDWNSAGGNTYGFRVKDDNPRIVLSKLFCQLDNTELLMAQTFAGGKVITQSDLNAPLKRFCVSVPAVVTDANSQQSYRDASLYWKLARNEAVTVPASTTYTLFWVSDQEPQVAFRCSANFGYDAEESVCVPSNAFAYFCEAGQFVDGRCVVQPEIFCPLNTEYDASANLCKATSAIIDCGASGVSGAVWNNERQVCVYVPPTQTICTQGDFDAVSGTCNVEGRLQTVCTQGGSWSQAEQACIKNLEPEVRVPATNFDCSDYDTMTAPASYNSSTGLCDVVPDLSPSKIAEIKTVKVEVVPLWVWVGFGGLVAGLGLLIVSGRLKI